MLKLQRPKLIISHEDLERFVVSRGVAPEDYDIVFHEARKFETKFDRADRWGRDRLLHRLKIRSMFQQFILMDLIPKLTDSKSP